MSGVQINGVEGSISGGEWVMSESSGVDEVENEEPSGAARSLAGAHHVTPASDLTRLAEILPMQEHRSSFISTGCFVFFFLPIFYNLSYGFN